MSSEWIDVAGVRAVCTYTLCVRHRPKQDGRKTRGRMATAAGSPTSGHAFSKTLHARILRQVLDFQTISIS